MDTGQNNYQEPGVGNSTNPGLEGSLVGDHVLERVLGAGGMGTVYQASGPLGDVAIKLVHSHLCDDEAVCTRFQREARAGRRVDHPNVVRTLSAGAAVLGGVEQQYLVMELVEGQTLRELVAELGCVPEGLSRRLGTDIARGLSAIHASDVLHRDLKPENVMVTGDNCIKVMDLGVARLVDATNLSRAGTFVGSIRYAAPEQFIGTSVDARLDLYALGHLLYELVVGHHVFGGDNDAARLMHRQINEVPPRLTKRAPQCSPFVEEIVAALLEKNPDKRPGSAAELVEILEQGEESAWWRERSRSLRSEWGRTPRRALAKRETGLHGRKTELDRLRSLYDLARNGAGQVVLVSGEAGIGKTRFVDELGVTLAEQGEDFDFLYGGYPPGGGATASGAVLSALGEFFGPDQSQTAVRELLGGDEHLGNAFAALLRGEPDRDSMRLLDSDGLRVACARTLRALARVRPVVLCIDDLHFAPDEGRALFASLAAAVRDDRVLLIGTMRRNVSTAWVAALDRLDHVTKFAIERLGPKQLTSLLVEAFKSRELAEEMGFRIAAKSDGNPFFVFEIIRELSERSLIRRGGDGRWQRTGEVQEIHLPSSVTDLIRARLSKLDDDDQDLLELAACAGFEFDPLVVARALGEPEVRVLRRLSRLERRHHLVRSEGRSYVFDHHQIQEALYRGLAPLLREQYHGLMADALVSGDEAPAGKTALQCCHHSFRAARPQDALAVLEPALAHCEAIYESEAAIDLARNALKAEGGLEGRARGELLLRCRAWLDRLGRRVDERRVLDDAVELAGDLGDDELLCRAKQDLGVHLERTTRYAESRDALESAVALAQRLGRTDLEHDARRHLGINLMYSADYERSREELGCSCEQAGKLGDEWAENAACANLAVVRWYLGYSDDALSAFLSTVEYFRRHDDRGALPTAYCNLGLLLSDLGMHEAGRERLDRALELVRERGDQRIEAFALDWRGLVLERLGDAVDAREHLERSLALRRGIADQSGTAESLAGLGRLALARDDFDEARRVLDETISLAHDDVRPGILVVASAQRARVPRADATDAIALRTEHDARLRLRERIETDYALFSATHDQEHLERAHKGVMLAQERAPERNRESLVEAIPMHRAIVEAWATRQATKKADGRR